MPTPTLDSDQSEKFAWLKEAIDEGMADVAAGRVVEWDLEEILRSARAQRVSEGK